MRSESSRRAWDEFARRLATGTLARGAVREVGQAAGVPHSTARSIYQRYFREHHKGSGPGLPKKKPKRPVTDQPAKRTMQRRTATGGQDTIEVPDLEKREVKKDWASISEAFREVIAHRLGMELGRQAQLEALLDAGIPLERAKAKVGPSYIHQISQVAIPAGIATDKAMREASADGGAISVTVVAPGQEKAHDGGIFAQPAVGAKRDAADDDDKEEGAA